jgi:hypothetical protein
MYLLVQYLVKEGKGPIYFYDLESPEDMELLKNLDFPKTLPENSFIFVDEIQYHPQPDKFIKLTVDHLKNRVKLICSGSSNLNLRKKFRESLMGRKFEFVLYPLNFNEFLTFKGKKDTFRNIHRLHPKRYYSSFCS